MAESFGVFMVAQTALLASVGYDDPASLSDRVCRPSATRSRFSMLVPRRIANALSRNPVKQRQV